MHPAPPAEPDSLIVASPPPSPAEHRAIVLALEAHARLVRERARDYETGAWQRQALAEATTPNLPGEGGA